MNDITLVGIDTGGTFTDIVVLEHGSSGSTMRQCKVLSDPSDPSSPIVEGLRRLGLENRKLQIIHGTTVGTNAVLEGKGARVAYISSEGFADVLTLGRQEREQVYQLRQPETEPPVPRESLPGSLHAYYCGWTLCSGRAVMKSWCNSRNAWRAWVLSRWRSTCCFPF